MTWRLLARPGLWWSVEDLFHGTVARRDAKIADFLLGDAPTILTKYQFGEAVDKDRVRVSPVPSGSCLGVSGRP